MRNCRRSFVKALTIFASLILFVGSLVINEHSLAQKPNPKPATTDTTPQQPTRDELNRDLWSCQCLQRINAFPVPKDFLKLAGSIAIEEWLEKWIHQTPSDPNNAHDPNTGQNFVWDSDKQAWINAKTGECVCPKCPATTTPPPSSKPSPAPTPNPTPTLPVKNGGNAMGYHVDSNTANGLYVTTFDTPQGKIKVNLTDDVAAGDTISGTVETEPVGKNDAERAQDQTELNGFVIELEGQKFTVGDKKFTCNIPSVLTPEARTIVLQLNGQTVAITQIPILVTRPPTPNTFTLPTGGQQGKPIQLKGPCDGVFAPNDSIKVGPTILPPVAESPRSLVVLNTSDVLGPTNIDCNENGVAMQCPFRNIGIKLSAPKLNLQRGETTTLHVVVMGLAGITKDELLDLADNTPNVIKMSGGEIQHIIIHPAEVQRDGTYSTDRTLTGIMSGGFGVTATVRWSDVCKHPATQ